MTTFLIAVATFIAGYFLAKRTSSPTPTNVDQHLKDRIQDLERQNKILATKADKLPVPPPAPLPVPPPATLPETENWAAKFREIEEKYLLERAERYKIEAVHKSEVDILNLEINLLKEQQKAKEIALKTAKEHLAESQQQEKNILQKHRKEMNQLCVWSKIDAIEHYQKQEKNLRREKERLVSDISNKTRLLNVKKQQAVSASLTTIQMDISRLELERKNLQSIQKSLAQNHSVVTEYLANLEQSLAQ